MDVAAIRSLMRKTQACILENGFLGLDDPKHVSVASFFLKVRDIPSMVFPLIWQILGSSLGLAF